MTSSSSLGIEPARLQLLWASAAEGQRFATEVSRIVEEVRALGPLVIDPREPDPVPFDREHVVMLTDWTDERPERVFKKLKKQSLQSDSPPRASLQVSDKYRTTNVIV